MSSNPSRAVYIPPAKRKRPTQPRFHGAFTGGFSAGYFNTVDTKEGWKPSTEKGREQQLEDFMDDQDHQEWGGPTTVRQDYKISNEIKSSSAAPLALLLTISRPPTVGPRLLRRLGWREETGAAYVPAVASGENDVPTAEDTFSKIHLSKKRLRQIQLQSSRIQLPPPKLDHCGLGFEAHENAPEFKQYREQRQEKAKLRARGQSSVYRISDVNGSDDVDGRSERGQQPHIDGGDYVSYETPEDFVGTHSASGFALRDDEDDVYDPLALGGDRNARKSSAKEKLLSEEYNTEIVDIDDDSDVEDSATPHGDPKKSTTTSLHAKRMNTLLGGVLSSWAGKDDSQAKQTSSSIPSASLTSTGRPPVTGFRLGGSMEAHKQRYPGPDLPRDYRPTRHVFGPNEHPSIFQTIGRALQLEGEQQALQQHKKEQVQKNETRSNLPLLANNQFATLARAMKNRFTASTDSSQYAPTTQETSTRIGLYQPPSVHTKEETKEVESGLASTSPKPIVVRRSTLTFIPLPLLCKRFGVEVPRVVNQALNNPTKGRTTEATYFEREVLPTAREGALSSNRSKIDYDGLNHTSTSDKGEAAIAEESFEISRPSREKLKAVFEPESDEASTSSADTDLDSIEQNVVTKKELKLTTASVDAKSLVDYGSPQKHDGPLQDKLVEYQERELMTGATKKNSDLSSHDNISSSSSEDSISYRQRKRKKSEKNGSRHKKRKRSKRSKRNHESANGDLSSEGGEGKRRKRDSNERSRKHGKKRKKTHSSRSDVK